jgi:hypothetical protein
MGFRTRWLLAALVVLIALPATAHASGCDPIDSSACLYPWPNNYFTKHDSSTATHRRLNLTLDEMPANAAGVPIDPTAQNRNDGFSPGSLIVTRVPGLDTPAAFNANNFPTNTHPELSFDPAASAAVIDATDKTHPRSLIWAELEYPASAGAANTDQTLVIHPGKNLTEGHRYIVALRKLVDAKGAAIPASAAFAAYRDNKAHDSRAKHFRSIFRTLANAGIERKDLYLAWDFTVASERNLSERMLHIRNDAFGQLGDHDLADRKVDGSAPIAFVYPDLPDDAVSQGPDVPVVGNPLEAVDGQTNFSSGRLLRIVRGRVLVPCYLTTPECASGGSFNYGLDGRPQQIPGNYSAADFECIIPRSVLTRGPARVSLYGHGLLGDASQVAGGAIQDLANEQNIVLCATDWIGMASEDLPNAVSILANLSHFDSLADRGQQGMLNFLYLGRSLIHPDGLSNDPAFQVNGQPAFKRELYYDGGSQGGIMGGSLTAVAPDFTRAALGVPGMNYSILLQRSVDFDTYAQVMYNAYPNRLVRPLVLSLVQLLWDRAEADGYAHHMTSDPLEGTPAHEVILDMAYGDHQVSNWATIVEARTIGAQIRTPVLYPSRSLGDNVFYGIPAITSYPATGSLFEVWDVGPLRTEGGKTKGTPPPPIGNEPNRQGVDPHGPDASEQVSARAQIGAFLQPDSVSVITPVCGDEPCKLDGWLGS